MPASVLIVDDDSLVRFTLSERMRQEGHSVIEAGTGAAALAAFEDVPDVVLLDVRLPDMDGLSVLRALKKVAPDTPVILLTAHSSVEHAVSAIQEGAFHYVKKPFELDAVAVLVSRALEQTELSRELRLLRASAAAGLEDVIGESPAMRHVKSLVQKIAASATSTVLLTGESGTGKDLIARTIHEQSTRARGPFVNITCSALPETLLESELFGHEKGAFTDARQQKKGLFEQAAGGTVFLDEIGETSLAFQAKLLRFLEEKSFRRVGGVKDVHPDVRIVAATNQDLATAIEKKGFREDLFYRLAVVHIVVPPLREREDDIERLVRFFIDRFNREFGKQVKGLTDAAREMLNLHPWPGNVRELRNAVERAMLFTSESQLDVADFQGISSEATRSESAFKLPSGGVNLRKLERDLVAQALARAGGNQTRAATLLGLNRDQIRYRIQKFELNADADAKAPTPDLTSPSPD
jgi:DNA-binding NtrC family response regulator